MNAHHYRTPARHKARGIIRLASLILLLPLAELAHAEIPLPPGGGGTSPPPCLDSWSFNDTNTWTSDKGYSPISFSNLSSCWLGQESTLVLDSTNAAWLRYNVVENDGTTNLTVDNGSVMFWFAPTSWSGTNESGAGPGQWGRLLEAGAYTSDASYGWWSLYLDPDGVNIYFSAQTNGQTTTYLSAPIDWNTNRWHLIALTYSPTNTALYLDATLVTNGPGMSIWPGPDVLTNGFSVGSDGGDTGIAQAHGMYDQLTTYNYQVDSNTVQNTYWYNSIWYYANPMNFANFSQAPSTPQVTPTFVAIAGAGYLTNIGTVANCVSSSNVWLTNIVATLTTNGGVNLTFSIMGGSNGLPYDVFATSALTSPITNGVWTWMGQGYQCNTYMITNIQSSAAFLILGTPLDSDGDGLTDAYELLVSHTNPHVSDTSGDGMLDGWKVLWGLNPLLNNPNQVSERSTFSYDLASWLRQVSGVRGETIGVDPETNVLNDQ